MIIGITGGIGAGKSTVVQYMKENYNVYVIVADDVAKQLQNPGGTVYREMIDAFGEDIVNDDRTLNRRKVAMLIFSDERKRRQLNAMVHPAVRQEIERQIRSYRDRYEHIVIEAALLIEEHYDDICDEFWYIDAKKELRIKRLMDSRGYDRDHCERIMAGQLSKEQFQKACSVMIDNSGDMEWLKEQLNQLLGRMKDASSI